MTGPANTLAMPLPEHSFVDRVVTLAAWGVGGAIFLTVGWFAMAPVDPLGVMTLAGRGNGAFVFLQAAALAAVTAAVSTALAGRRLPDVGMFAACIGLAAVSLRGATSEYLLLQNVETGTTERGLTLRLILDLVAWLVIVAGSGIVSSWVARWCFGIPQSIGATGSLGATGGLPASAIRFSNAHFTSGIPAGMDAPGLAPALRVPPDRLTPVSDGCKHTVIAAGVGILVMFLLLTACASSSIQHGQACFVVVASTCLACYVAHRLFPTESALWSILAVVLISLIAFGWTLLRSPSGHGPATIPASGFLRILPIQYASVGTASAVAMLWHMYTPRERAQEERPISRRNVQETS